MNEDHKKDWIISPSNDERSSTINLSLVMNEIRCRNNVSLVQIIGQSAPHQHIVIRASDGEISSLQAAIGPEFIISQDKKLSY